MALIPVTISDARIETPLQYQQLLMTSNNIVGTRLLQNCFTSDTFAVDLIQARLGKLYCNINQRDRGDKKETSLYHPSTLSTKIGFSNTIYFMCGHQISSEATKKP